MMSCTRIYVEPMKALIGQSSKKEASNTVEEHRSLGGSIIIRLDNGAFFGLIHKLMVFS